MKESTKKTMQDFLDGLTPEETEILDQILQISYSDKKSTAIWKGEINCV